MTDVREQILTRLSAVAGLAAAAVDVSDSVTVGRNKTQLSDSARPAIIVMDGSEQTEDGYGRGRPSTTPIIVTMRPEVWVFAGALPEDIGELMSAFRATIIKKVLTDPDLLNMSKDGDLRYEGCTTRFTSGARIEGDLGVMFALRYVLRPTEL